MAIVKPILCIYADFVNPSCFHSSCFASLPEVPLFPFFLLFSGAKGFFFVYFPGPSFAVLHFRPLQSLTVAEPPLSTLMTCLSILTGDLLRRFPLLASVPLPPALIFWVCLECPLILAAPLQDPLVLHCMLTILPEAPLALFCFCDPMKLGDLLRLLPELARVPWPPALIFWVCLEFPLILAAPLQEPFVLHCMLTIEPTAPSAFCCVWEPIKEADPASIGIMAMKSRWRGP